MLKKTMRLIKLKTRKIQDILLYRFLDWLFFFEKELKRGSYDGLFQTDGFD